MMDLELVEIWDRQIEKSTFWFWADELASVNKECWAFRVLSTFFFKYKATDSKQRASQATSKTELRQSQLCKIKTYITRQLN